MDLVSLVSNNDQRFDQNVMRNRLSQSETMVCGIPKFTHTHSKKSLTVASIVMLFLQATILAGDHNHHLGKEINNHKKEVISLLD
jgi:hypothetical protein